MPYNRSDYREKWRIVRIAATIRSRVGLDQLSTLSPWRLADEIPAHIFYPEDFDNDGLARRVSKAGWDAFAFCCPGESTLMIVLNPNRPPTRQTATLMEELSHHLLGHKPCQIAIDPDTGILQRTYDQVCEHEAYDLGAALLLPKERIQRDIAAELAATQIAAAHQCSHEIVTYRIKRMRLWPRYSRYAA